MANSISGRTRKKWLSRPEAAAILGVTAQTVTNLAREGALPQKRRGRLCYYPADRVEALSRVADMEEISDLSTAIKSMKEQMRSEYKVTRDLYKRKRAEFLLLARTPEAWRRYIDVVNYAMDYILEKDCLAEREKEIIRDVMRFMTPEEIAEKYYITRERVRQIFINALRHLERYPAWMEWRLTSLRDEIDRLLVEKAELITERDKAISERDRALERKSAASSVEDEDNDESRNLVRFMTEQPFTIQLRDIGVSVRAYNCCTAAEIRTLGDLVSYTPSELMKFRNFGKKNFKELDQLIGKFHLTWGMWKNNPNKKY